MTRLTAKDFPQQLLEYYDYYAHGKISKREFLQLAGEIYCRRDDRAGAV
ncbi:putative enzyme [Klebsiella pneumoniae]|uniref:Putative enzyme n=1 Tax=Klebsiella pneumoniae TaxID=573 RepID=A0A2X1S2C1_KLEPN|nr:putative enzyme [Klebsiella pneumoniae]